MRTHLSLPILGAAALTTFTVGALLLQLSRKPDPKPRVEPLDRASADVDFDFVERLRARGL